MNTSITFENESIVVLKIKKEDLELEKSKFDKIFFDWRDNVCEAYVTSGSLKQMGELKCDVVVSGRDKGKFLKFNLRGLDGKKN